MVVAGMYSVNVDYNPEPQAEAREGLGSSSSPLSIAVI